MFSMLVFANSTGTLKSGFLTSLVEIQSENVSKVVSLESAVGTVPSGFLFFPLFLFFFCSFISNNRVLKKGFYVSLRHVRAQCSHRKERCHCRSNESPIVHKAEGLQCMKRFITIKVIKAQHVPDF